MRAVFLLSLSLLLVACGQAIQKGRAASVSTPPSSNNSQQLEQQQAIDALISIVSGDAIHDAEKSSQANDWRLWAYHDRAGIKVPGIDADTVSHRDIKVAPAMGDVIYSEQHLQAYQQFLGYATRYNQHILSLQAD